MMRTDLNSGVGTVMAQAQVDLRIPRNLAMTGGVPTFFDVVFRGVHAVNRRAARAHGYVAVTFPEYRIEGKGLKSWGNLLRLVGSETSLAEVLCDDRIASLLSGQATAMLPYAVTVGDAYAAFRDRGREKQGLGRVKRLIRRAERNGKPTQLLLDRYERLIRSPPPPQERVLHVDMVRHDVRVRIVSVSHRSDRLEATSYGLSARSRDSGKDHLVPFSLIALPATIPEEDPYANFYDD